MSDDELKLTRRLFLQQSAMISATTAGYYSIAMKTDALAQQPPLGFRGPEDISPYPYSDPPE